MMFSTFARLIDRLDSQRIKDADVIPWGSPVPFFGDPSSSKVATLGLNPSNREFVDNYGKELVGDERRFHTLKSLDLENWTEIDAKKISKIVDSCVNYFSANPYDRWFRRLDAVMAGASASYYDMFSNACHLDLIPYATSRKWAELSCEQRLSLLDISGDCLGNMLRETDIRVLVLNGMSVVSLLQTMIDQPLERIEMPSWTLSRTKGNDIFGYGYFGVADSISGVYLDRPIVIAGFNHNIQSSFGVTTAAIKGIRNWLADIIEDATT